MAFVWLFGLLTLMAGPSRGKKINKGKKVKLDKNKPIIGRFTIGDFADSDAEDSMDWDALSSSDEEAPVQGPYAKEEKEEEVDRAPSPTIIYTRKKSAKDTGVRFNETVISPQWGQRQPLRSASVRESSQPSSAHAGESSQNPASIPPVHQRLVDEQAKLAMNFEKISAELKIVKKKQNKLSRMLKNMYSLIGCSNSIVLDSDSD